MPRLRNTPQLKQARSKVSSIAGYYAEYKKKATRGYGGAVSAGRMSLGQLRANDYIRAHKDEIWAYRREFTVQFFADNPLQAPANRDLRQAPANEGNNENINEEHRPGGTGEQSLDESRRSSSNSSSYVSESQSEHGDGQGDLNEIQPDLNGAGEQVAPENPGAQGNAPAQGEVSDAQIEGTATRVGIINNDLDRLFSGDTKKMINDYFAIVQPGGDETPENRDNLQAVRADRGALIGDLEKADARKSAAGDAGMDDGLTEAQKSGLSEIAKFLYQNCARRSRDKITLLDGLLQRSARERLLIYYLVEKNVYDSPGERHIIQSQTYTPDVRKFKEVIKRKSYNIFGRLFIGAVHWSYLSKAAQVATDCRDKLRFMFASGLLAQPAAEPARAVRAMAGNLLPNRDADRALDVIGDQNILDVSDLVEEPQNDVSFLSEIDDEPNANRFDDSFAQEAGDLLGLNQQSGAQRQAQPKVSAPNPVPAQSKAPAVQPQVDRDPYEEDEKDERLVPGKVNSLSPDLIESGKFLKGAEVIKKTRPVRQQAVRQEDVSEESEEDNKSDDSRIFNKDASSYYNSKLEGLYDDDKEQDLDDKDVSILSGVSDNVIKNVKPSQSSSSSQPVPAPQQPAPQQQEQPEPAQQPAPQQPAPQQQEQPEPAQQPAPQQQPEQAQPPRQPDAGLVQDRNDAFTNAMAIGREYIAAWKAKGSLPDEQQSQQDRNELEGLAKAYERALKRLIVADNNLLLNYPEPVALELPGDAATMSAIRDQGTPTTSVTGRKWERAASGIVSKKNWASVGIIASQSATLADRTRNIAMAFNPDMWSQPGGWNWGNQDFGKNLSSSMANQWGWRIEGVFPTIEGIGTGTFSTIGGIMALITFASGLRNIGATLKKGSAGDIAKYVTSQLGLLVSASKDAMTDTVVWNTILKGAVSPQAIANLSSAAAVAGVVGGAINIALGAVSIHSGRTANQKLNAISNWVEQSVQNGRAENATPEMQREAQIINTANAAARSKASHNVRSGVSQTVSGAMFMIGGILSMSVAGAPLGAVLMLLGGGLSMVNTIVGYAKNRKRRRAMIDDYIGIDKLVEAVRRYDENAADLPDEQLKEYIREEAVGLMGFTSENGCFDYIAGRLAKALIGGIKKNAIAMDVPQLQNIANHPEDYLNRGNQKQKQVANYIMMIRSFGPRVKVGDDREFTPNAAALAKSIAKA